MNPQGKEKHSFYDRADGHVVKDSPALNSIISLLYPNRCDCEVSANFEMDVTELMAYIDKRNEESRDARLKFFHCFITALVRVFYERSWLNRFVRGGRIYEHNDISVSFVAKRKFADGAAESLLTYRAKDDDTVDDVSRFIAGEVKDVRKENPKTNNAEELVEKMAKKPLIIRKAAAIACRILDYWGILPKSLMKGDPAFSSVLVANLGSIGFPSAYHHLNNYGSCSMMITIGALTEKTVTDPDGKQSKRQFVDITATGDERVADGFYFSKSIKLLEKILSAPELLEIPFSQESGLVELIK